MFNKLRGVTHKLMHCATLAYKLTSLMVFGLSFKINDERNM